MRVRAQSMTMVTAEITNSITICTLDITRPTNRLIRRSSPPIPECSVPAKPALDGHRPFRHTRSSLIRRRPGQAGHSQPLNHCQITPAGTLTGRQERSILGRCRRSLKVISCAPLHTRIGPFCVTLDNDDIPAILCQLVRTE